MATTTISAGAESNQVLISYALETVFATLPAVPFQAIRVTGDSLKGTKTRNRPAELNTTGEVSAAVTTQVQATGSIPYALSFGTFDDLIAAAFSNTWQTPVTLAGVAGDMSLAVGGHLTSTTAGKFAAITVGQWVRLLGFPLNGAANFPVGSVIAQVTAVTSAMDITLSEQYSGAFSNSPVAVPYVAETPTGTTAQVRASTMRNGTVAQTVYLQKKFAAALFLRYPGTYISGFSISGGVGQFLSGSITVLASSEVDSTTDASTGAVVAAPGGRVHDPIAGFQGIYINGVPIGAVVDSFTISIAKTGAALEYGLGSASGQGLIEGLTEVTGSFKVFFNSLTLYDRYKNELLGNISVVTQDPAGNAYVITVLNGALMSQGINAGSQNSAVYAMFDLEGNPLPGGGTIQIDRLPAV